MRNLTLLALAGVILGVAGCKPKPRELPLQTVLALAVDAKSQPVYEEWIGTLNGSVNATIRAQVGGYLIKQNYQEGSFVKTGEVLFEIDPRNYQSALDQAKGTLASKQATALKSQQDMERYKTLVASGAVSQQEYQNEVQTYQAAQADAAAAQAAVVTAQNNLDYTKIKSAIDGVAGIAQAQVGDLITANSQMTTVSTINPIKVSFNISEQRWLTFLQKHPEQAQREAAKKNAVLQLILSDGVPYGILGSIDFVNRQVDQSTGTIQVIGIVDNPNGVLRPGSYVRVRVSGKEDKDAILVPQRAVMQLQTSYLMAVVNPDNTISMRTVEVGNRIGDQWVITDGLKSGDKIVVEGVNKVRDGQKVNVQPYVGADAPSTEPAKTQTNAAPAS